MKRLIKATQLCLALFSISDCINVRVLTMLANSKVVGSAKSKSCWGSCACSIYIALYATLSQLALCSDGCTSSRASWKVSFLLGDWGFFKIIIIFSSFSPCWVAGKVAGKWAGLTLMPEFCSVWQCWSSSCSAERPTLLAHRWKGIS